MPFTKNTRVADIMQFGDAVVKGYEQSNVTHLPKPLLDNLQVLVNTLAEGMQEAYQELKNKDPDSAVAQAEIELFMDMQRRFTSKVPGYKEKAGSLLFSGF